MAWWLRLIRFPNLVIVALTQYLLFYALLLPAFEQAGFLPLLDPIHFFLLVLDTMLIAAGGYVINDYYDQAIDAQNKPGRQIVGTRISGRQALLWYGSILLAGAMLALYLAIYVSNLSLFSIYPAACLLLWLYSRYWKKALLLGNLTVAVFCALVAWIIWFAERGTVGRIAVEDPSAYSGLRFAIGLYLGYAFLSTLYREVIKDIEDADGDAQEQARTLPVLYGQKAAKIFSFGVGCLLLGLLLPLIELFWNSWALLGLGLLVILPLIFSFYLLWQAENRAQFHRLSQLAKFIMLGGILLLFFL
ncbi:MAG: geranylgeranylglycerol-phosphate geranylgeranyltransferase [Phaeodactylibacter sp.]|nr:geranylgeranylglycerol-phosphate geranylgeranyltransferase [Phaeodactylibacter sp.]